MARDAAASIPNRSSCARSSEPWDAIVSDYNLPGFSGLVALELLKASGSRRAVHAGLRRDRRGHRGRGDAQRRQRLPAEEQPGAPGAGAAARGRGRRDAARARRAPTANWARRKQRLRELAQHLQTSVESERAAIAREIHDDVGGSLTALKFDLAWIARHCELAAGAPARAVGAGDGDPRDRGRASASCTTCARRSSSRAWWRRCSGWRSRFERRTGVACRSAAADEAARAAGRRAAGGLPHGAGGADQHQQACAGDAGADRPVAGRRRAVARDQRQRPRPRARTTWPRRARSASAACTSAPSTVGGWVDLSQRRRAARR